MKDIDRTLQAQTDGESDPAPSAAQITEMFDRIAPRYDLLNRLLSFGRDVAWRRAMASHLPPGANQRVLDLATGTADQLVFLFEQSHRVASGVGLDVSENMLRIGREKVRRRGLEDRVNLRTGDATAIPESDREFDLVTISFGIRNVDRVQQALQEMLRVLRPGGRALILEFSLPGNAFIRFLHLINLRYVLPLIGGLVSGHYRAYRYLNRTIETFPSGEAFCEEMRQAGFTRVSANPLTFGVASIYRGDKAELNDRDGSA